MKFGPFLLSITFVGCGGEPEAPAEDTDAVIIDPLNVLMILVDDLDVDTMNQMLTAGRLPHIKKLLVDQGVTFENSFVAEPICCPSRATWLTGQYPHNHGVLSLDGRDGGYDKFHACSVVDGQTQCADMNRPTLGKWLAWPYEWSDGTAAPAYYTGLAGKYLNGYQASHLVPGETDTVPHWSLWRGLVRGGGGAGESALLRNTYRVMRNDRSIGTVDKYQTRQIGDIGIEIVRDGGLAQQSGKPFFLVLTPTAPHVSQATDLFGPAPSCSQPHPQWTQRVDVDGPGENGYEPSDYAPHGCSYPRGCLRSRGTCPDSESNPIASMPLVSASKDSFDNPNPSEPWIEAQGWCPIGEPPAINRCNLQRLQLDRMEAMLSIDVMVKKVIEAIPSEVLERTMVIFTSDNGYHLGENYLGNKSSPFDESTRVPLIVRVPNRPGRRCTSEIALNVDLAPTILDYAGRDWRAPGYNRYAGLDGRSLRPLLETARECANPTPSGVRWRDAAYIEQWHVRYGDPFRRDWWHVPDFTAVRTTDRGLPWSNKLLVDYASPEWSREGPYLATAYYDLNLNRDQNVARPAVGPDFAVLEWLRSGFEGCRGKVCRDRESNRGFPLFVASPYRDGPCEDASPACRLDTQHFVTIQGSLWNSITQGNRYFNYEGYELRGAGKLSEVPKYSDGPDKPCYRERNCTFTTRTHHPTFGWESISVGGWFFNLGPDGRAAAPKGRLANVPLYRQPGGPCADVPAGGDCIFDTRCFSPIGNTRWESITRGNRYYNLDLSGNIVPGGSGLLSNVPRYRSGPCRLFADPATCAFDTREVVLTADGNRIERITAKGRLFTFVNERPVEAPIP